MRLTTLLLSFFFILALTAQNPVLRTIESDGGTPTMVLDFDRMMTPEELAALQDQPEMMCTAMPELAILNCQADDRTDPNNMVAAGRIEWRVEGGANPVSCRLISDAGPIYTIVGGFGPGFNLYNSPRDFSVNNTTTSQTCIVMGGYTIEVTDALGCVRTCQVNFVPTCFDYASSISPTTVGSTCNSNGGSINLGTIPDAYCPDDPNAGNVSYQWSNGATTPGINNVPPGLYSVTISDFYGCQGILEDIEIPAINGLETSPCVPNSPTLIGGNDGSITFNILGGAPPFSYSWVGPTTGSSAGNFGLNTVPGLVEGNYTVTIVDANGCEETCTVFVMNPPCTFGTSCPPAPNSDNSVSFFLVGGVGPYTISWSGGDTGSETINTNNFTTPPLANGDYTFVLQDANGEACEVTCMITVFVVDCATLMLSDTTITHASCAGSATGAIDITLVGGYPDFTFDWSGPNGFTDNTEDISGLVAGTYTLNINDEEGCDLTDLTFIVEEPDDLAVTCSGTPSNFGDDDGTFSVNITGGTPPYELDLNGTIFNSYPSDSIITDLAPDVYTATVTDANGCTEMCFFEIEEIQCDISYTTVVVNPSCPGADDGSITVTLMDAAGDSTIVWSVMGNDNNPVLDGLVAGDYELTVGDTNCILATETITLTDPAELSIDLSLVDAINCHGDSTASLTTALTNGVAPFDYVWNTNLISDGETAPTGLPAGEYQVTVTDDNGCEAADTIIITEPADLVLNCSSTNETASGLNDGTITIDFSGVEPFTISGGLDSTGLTAADAPIVFNNVPPDTYSYTITDANGCTEECTVVVDPGGCIMTVSVMATQPDCSAPNQGSFLATVSNGTAPFTYTWTPDLGDTDNPTNVPDGPYELLVTDANGCSATSQDTLYPFTAFPALAVMGPDSICDGACVDVNLTLTGTPPFMINYVLVDQSSSASSPATITVFSNDTTLNICPSDLPSGGSVNLDDYAITVNSISDMLCGNDIAVDETYVINHFSLASDTIRQTYCEGDVVTIAGQDFDQFTPNGEVTLSGQSANGCDSLVVVDLTFVGAVSGTVNTTLCPGESLTIEGNVFDEATPMGFFLSSTPSVLGCDSIVNVNLSFFPPATGTFTPTICATDNVTVGGVVFDATNTSGDVVLANASVNGCDSTVSVALDFFPAATGVLTPTICSTDDFVFEGNVFNAANPSGDVLLPGASVNGCDSTVTVTVDFFPAATGTFTPTICATDNVTIGGVVFNATNTSGDVTLPGASVNGCDSTVSVALSFFPAATGILNPTICSTDDFVFEGNVFNTANPSGDVLLPGASVNGCDSTVTVTVDFFPAATGTFTPTICATDNVTVGGVVFDATNTSGDVTLPGASVNGCDSTVSVALSFFPAATGILNPTICSTDDFVFEGNIFNAANPSGDVVLPGASVNGCDSTVSVTLDFFPIATGVLNPTICNTDNFVFGGTTFDINTPSGDVVLAGASVNGCDSTVSVSLDFFPAATGVFSTTICETDQFTLGGVTFDFNTPNGDVVLAGASANGCDSTVSVSLDFFAPAVGSFSPTLCPGESVELGGQTFNQANPSGAVVLAGASANGCDSTIQVAVAFSEPLEVSLTAIEGNCSDEAFILTFDYNGGGDLEINLSNTTQPSYVLPAGTNSLTVTPAGGTTISLINALAASETCPLTFAGSVDIPQAPTIAINVLSGDDNNQISCAGGDDGHLLVELTGEETAAYNYSWSNGATTSEIEGLTAGSYAVTATHPDGCTVSAEVLLNEPLPMLFTASTLEGDCFGNPPGVRIDTVDGGAGGPYLYRFDQAAFAPIVNFPVDVRYRVGSTTLEVQDINGCTTSQEFELVDPPVGVLTISPEEPVLLLGDSIRLSAQTNLAIDSAIWSPAPTSTFDLQRLSQIVRPTENTTYSLTVFDAEGCSVSASVTVRVDRNVPVFIPTGFSPNNDGVNDIFTFFGDRGIVDYQDFYVFDRWGDVVHKATGSLTKNDPAWGWNGSHRGETLNPGVYVFQIYVNLEDGRQELLKGEVTLLK